MHPCFLSISRSLLAATAQTRGPTGLATSCLLGEPALPLLSAQSAPALAGLPGDAPECTEGDLQGHLQRAHHSTPAGVPARKEVASSPSSSAGPQTSPVHRRPTGHHSGRSLDWADEAREVPGASRSDRDSCPHTCQCQACTEPEAWAASLVGAVGAAGAVLEAMSTQRSRRGDHPRGPIRPVSHS